MAEKVELSNSKLMAVQTCGIYYRNKYLDQDQRPGTLRMHRGSAVHSVGAEGHRRQYEAKKLDLSAPLKDVLSAALPNEEEARDLAATAFDERIADGVTISKEDIQDAGGQNMAIGNAKDAAVDMAAYYTTRVAPTINPVAFERRITVKPKDTQFVVRGILDLVEAEEATENEPAGEIIPDLKTSEKSPPGNMADRDQQLTFYAMLRAAEMGSLPKAEVLRYIVRTPKTHALKRVELRTQVTWEDVKVLVKRIDAAVDSIQKGVFVPAAPNHWKCTARWCEYFATCEYAFKR